MCTLPLSQTCIHTHSHTGPSSDLHWDSGGISTAWLQLFHGGSGYPATTIPKALTKGTTPRQSNTRGGKPSALLLLQPPGLKDEVFPAQKQHTPPESPGMVYILCVEPRQLVTVTLNLSHGESLKQRNIDCKCWRETGYETSRHWDRREHRYKLLIPGGCSLWVIQGTDKTGFSCKLSNTLSNCELLIFWPDHFWFISRRWRIHPGLRVRTHAFITHT